MPIEELPFSVFDSSIQDVHFFAGTDSYFLGLGIARHEIFSFQPSREEIGNILSEIARRSSKEIIIFGGWSFPPSHSEDQATAKKMQVWKDFPYSDWVIPALTLVYENGLGRIILAVNVENSSPRLLNEYYEGLVTSLGGLRRKSPVIPRLVRTTNIPPQGQWKDLVRKALASIRKGEFQKVVPARSVEMLFESDVPCSTVLRKLIQTNPEATIFAIKKGDAVFVGATPERLFTLKNGNLKVDCLAASAPRSGDPETDDLLGEDLLRDSKSLYEHKVVVDKVARSLSRICTRTEVSIEPTLKKLPNVQHLLSTVRGKLRPAVDVWSAAQILWPTPATSGEPRESAIRWIQDFEGIQRGWYSGVVGYVNGKADQGNLYVAIRSALIRKNTAFLFAGSGIVPGSDPQKEFEETNWKMKTMMNALGQ
ncbi:MAG: isochorismate synthase [Nitrososphaerota archaeon]|nr:isochorismate synthase [Nitrososphaerota archaeon]